MRHLLKWAALLFFLPLLIYAPSLGNGFFAMDDGMLIFQNNLIREISPQTLYTIFTNYDPELYIPLTFLSYQFDYLIGGYHPFIYHLTNLLLHAGSSVLVVGVVWLLLEKTAVPSLDTPLDTPFGLLGTTRDDTAKFIALFCGLLFAIHPLHTEAVAWASARKDVLSGFFFLGAFVSYLLWVTRNPEFGIRNPGEAKDDSGFPTSLRLRRASRVPNSGFRSLRSKTYLISIIAFILALLSKVTAITLPAILILTDWYQGRSLKDKKMWLNKIPYFLLSIIFGIIALGGKSAMLGQTNAFQKILLSCKMAVFAFWKLIVPVNLSVLYPELSPITIANPEFMFFTALVILVLFAAFRFRRYRIVPFSILFFLITLAPSAFSVMKGGNPFFFSDRYAYVPSIGVFLMIGFLLGDRGEFSIFNLRIFTSLRRSGIASLRQECQQHDGDPATRRREQFSRFNYQLSIIHYQLRHVLLIVVTIVLSVLTIHQSLMWGDATKLFARAVKLYPDFYLAHIDLGAAYKEEGRNEEALVELKKAVELYPLPNTFGVIGETEAELGNFGAAILAFREGIERHPEESELHYGLGQVYALMGESQKAMQSYERALELSESEASEYHTYSRRISSRRDMILMRMGIHYGERGDHKKAMEYYGKAIEENPWNADAYFNLGVGLNSTGDIAGAIENFKKAVEFDPDLIEAQVNLGILLFRIGQEEEAKEQFKEVLKIDPGNAAANQLLVTGF